MVLAHQIDLEILKEAKKELKVKKRRQAEFDFKDYPINEMIVCPFCNYEGKSSPKGSGKIYPEPRNQFMCFSCGERRKL